MQPHLEPVRRGHAQAVFAPTPQNYRRLAQALELAYEDFRQMAEGKQVPGPAHFVSSPSFKAQAAAGMGWISDLMYGPLDAGPWREMAESFRRTGEWSCRLPAGDARLAGALAVRLGPVDGARVSEGRLHLQLNDGAMLDLLTRGQNPLSQAGARGRA